MKEIRDWVSATAKYRKKWLWIFMPLMTIPATFLAHLADILIIPISIFLVISFISGMFITQIFKEKQGLQFTAGMISILSMIMLFPVLAMIQMRIVDVILLIIFFQLILLLFTLLIYLLERKCDVLYIIGPPPISPQLKKDIQKYIYWTLKNDKISIRNYANQIEVDYKGTSFRIVIKASSLTRDGNVEYTAALVTKGRKQDAEFRHIKTLINEAIQRLDRKRSIDTYPRPVRIRCRKQHTEVVYQPSADQYYCMKCRKIYNESQLEIQWSSI